LFPNAIPDDVLQLGNNQRSQQTPKSLPVVRPENHNNEVETFQSTPLENSLLPLKVAAARPACAHGIPKKRWQQLHFGEEDVDHSSHQDCYPLIDDEMRDEVVDAVLNERSAVQCSLKRKHGKI
jgi:hypothetical protein